MKFRLVWWSVDIYEIADCVVECGHNVAVCLVECTHS